MRIIKNWQAQLRERHIKKTLFQSGSHKSPVPFESARFVGVLFDATIPGQRDQVTPFIESLRKKGKEVLPIGYFDHKEDVSSYAFKAFNKKDLDWLGKPKKDILKLLTDKPFDALICIYKGECLPIEYLSAMSKSPMRVGPYTEKTYCYDLIIDTSVDSSIRHYLKEVDFYLNKINNKHESTKF